MVAALWGAALAGYLLSETLYGSGESYETGATATTEDELPWVAAAPGRVEPGSGEFKLGSAILGKVADVPVKVNDEVEAGELLIKLDDEEARARLAGAVDDDFFSTRVTSIQETSRSKSTAEEIQDE